MLKIQSLLEKKLFCFLLVFPCSVGAIQQLSAVSCPESFKKTSKWRAFMSSSLSNKNVMKITGLKSEDLKGLTILDIASGQTAFVQYAMEEGAKAALAVDLIDRPDNIPENLYLQGDITQLNGEEIKDRTGTLADLTIALSVFGYLEADTELWLRKLTGFTKPGGRIILDVTVPRSSVIRSSILSALHMSNTERIIEEDVKELVVLENILHKLKIEEIIENFRRKHRNSWLWYSSIGGKGYLKKFKKTSFTYEVTVASEKAALYPKRVKSLRDLEGLEDIILIY